MSTWLTLQGVVIALCLVSEWAVRGAGARANRAMRGLFAVALLAFLLPVPTGDLERFVPVQATASVRPVTAGLATLSAAAQPVARSISWVPWVAGIAVGLLLLWQVLVRVRMVRVAKLLHRRGRVRVAVSSAIPSPCAIWLGRTWILLDPHTAADPATRVLALQHEAQHIRHGDLGFAWVSAILVAICAPNPFAWRLARNLAELDEHAVDHALIHGAGVSPRQYGQLLLASATRSPVLSTAPGLAHTTPLHRRLDMLSTARPTRRLPWLFAIALVGTAAYAGSMPATPALHRHAVLDMPDHPLVDAAIDRLTETPKGKRFVSRALDRRPAQHDLIAASLDRAGLPQALEAVVLIESGYDDQLSTGDLDSAAPAGGPIGAGLWMFIPSTARTYGLQVDRDHDERLDPVLETEAAIALLTDLHDEFDDWGLALAGYNQGAAHVREAIATHHTRDVPTLIEAGALNRYVPMVWAATQVLPD